MGITRTIPPPPLDAFKRPKVSPVLILAGVLFALITLAVAYELSVMRAGLSGVLRHEVANNPRVRADFGQNVRVPYGVGWSAGGYVTVYADVEGSEATGYLIARLMLANGQWNFVRLEVHNLLEDHIVDLSPQPPAATVDQLHGRGRIYLVALGNSAGDEVNGLAKFLRDGSGVPAQVLSTVTLPPEAWDSRRKQWIGELLIEAMTAKFPDVAADPDAKIIGIIDADLYPRGLGWRFAYNYREFGKYAVIPTVRVNPTFFRRKAKDSITTERVQKIAMKLVGMFYFGFPETSNRASVMLWDHTPADLDRMSGKYLLSDLQTQTRDDNTAGVPCLTFSSANVGGLPRLHPIEVCREPYDVSEGTDYEVDLATGEFRLGRNDLYRSGSMPLVLRRLYFSHSYDGKTRAFGKSTWNNLDDTVWSTDPQSIQTIRVNGVEFSRLTPGVGFSPDAKYRAPSNQGDFSDALLTWEGGRWKIANRYGEVWHYMGCGPNTPVPCYFMDKTSHDGDSMEVVRDGMGQIEKARQETAADLPSLAASDHTWSFTYSGETVTSIQDSDGRGAKYRYEPDGFLTDVEADGHTLHYDYDDAHRMNRVVEDGRELTVHYDAEGRADEIDFPDHSAYRIRYGGETIEVAGPDATYKINMRDGFFQTNQ